MSPSGDTSMADFSMASISMGGGASSDGDGEGRSSRSDDSNTQVVKVISDNNKAKKQIAKIGSTTLPNYLGKLEEVEGDEEDGVH